MDQLIGIFTEMCMMPTQMITNVIQMFLGKI